MAQNRHFTSANTLRVAGLFPGGGELLMVVVEQVEAGQRHLHARRGVPADASAQLGVGRHVRIGQGVDIAQVGVERDVVAKAHRRPQRGLVFGIVPGLLDTLQVRWRPGLNLSRSSRRLNVAVSRHQGRIW